MNQIYLAINITKQGFHQKLNHEMRIQEEFEQLLPIIREIRKDHPKMSARIMYDKIKPQMVGRDRFEVFCFANGFKIDKKWNYKRTTNSWGVTRFPNCIQEKKVNQLNQVWVSDITYFEMGSRFYYLTFIMDLYSRKIVGYHASKNLFTEETTIPSLRMAKRCRRGNDLTGLIIHSDGGGQYYSKEFLKETSGMINSMCESVYENSHAERINGIIKNDYLKYYNPDNFDQLTHMLKKAVKCYNESKPHSALNKRTPDEFERTMNVISTKNAVINKRKKEPKKEKLLQSQLT